MFPILIKDPDGWRKIRDSLGILALMEDGTKLRKAVLVFKNRKEKNMSCFNKMCYFRKFCCSYLYSSFCNSTQSANCGHFKTVKQ